MSPRTVSEIVRHTPQLIRTTDTVEAAVGKLLESQIGALPVVDEDERFHGIFGEREFMRAVFPGYVDQLQGAAFLSRSLEDVLEKREACRTELVERYADTEHVEVDADHSDIQLAEIFLHHRALIVPVIVGGRVSGVITRADFFRALAKRFLAPSVQ